MPSAAHASAEHTSAGSAADSITKRRARVSRRYAQNVCATTKRSLRERARGRGGSTAAPRAQCAQISAKACVAARQAGRFVPPTTHHYCPNRFTEFCRTRFNVRGKARAPRARGDGARHAERTDRSGGGPWRRHAPQISFGPAHLAPHLQSPLFSSADLETGALPKEKHF